MRRTSRSSPVVPWLAAAVAGLVMHSTSVAQSPPSTAATGPSMAGEWAIDQLAGPVPEPASIDEGSGSLCSCFGHDREHLTGDWHGWRTGLEECGITFDLSTTQFYQGITRGGLERSFRYGGRNDYFLSLDGGKLGGWNGLTIDLHAETRYGESINFETGALSPVNEYLLLPGEEGTLTALTGVQATQYLSDDVFAYAGKINLQDAVIQPLTGATGLDGFMNISLIFNTIFARTLPYSAFGAGLVYLQEGEAFFTVSVYDTNNTPTTTGFESFFTDGALVFSTLVVPTKFLSLPGHQGLEAVYSTGRYTSFQKSPYLDLDGEPIFPGAPKSGSWAIGYLFDQALWVSPEDPERVWGVFGKLGWSDGNPNPIRWTAMAGISGSSPIDGRSSDTFGIGYFYLGLSNAVKRSVAPFMTLRDEQGVEVYYNARLSPWFHLTPDVQYIIPFDREADPVLALGVRARVDF